MHVRIQKNVRSNRYTHLLIFPELPARLRRLGCSDVLQAMTGSAEEPAIRVRIEASGPVPSIVDIPDEAVVLTVEPYTKHSSLNALVVLGGILPQLEAKGIHVPSAEKRAPGGSRDLAIRVKLEREPA